MACVCLRGHVYGGKKIPGLSRLYVSVFSEISLSSRQHDLQANMLGCWKVQLRVVRPLRALEFLGLTSREVDRTRAGTQKSSMRLSFLVSVARPYQWLKLQPSWKACFHNRQQLETLTQF